MKNLITTLLFILTSNAALATDCKNGKSLRKVDVVYETEGKKTPCSVKYTKEDGTEKTLFSAKAEEGYCEKKGGEFMEKIKLNGWDCEVKN